MSELLQNPSPAFDPSMYDGQLSIREQFMQDPNLAHVSLQPAEELVFTSDFLSRARKGEGADLKTQELALTVQAGDELYGIVKSQKRGEQDTNDLQSMWTVVRVNSDPKGRASIVGVLSEEVPFTLGRNTVGDGDMLLSRNHCEIRVMADGSVGVKDNNSTNGTTVGYASPNGLSSESGLTKSLQWAAKTDSVTEVMNNPTYQAFVSHEPFAKSASETGKIATRDVSKQLSTEQLASTVDKPEFEAGGVKYKINAQVEGIRNGILVDSVDASGVAKRFVVYQSGSQGELRASQGLENGRLLKGPEDSPNAQYTQDTLLHPDFSRQLSAALKRADRLQKVAEGEIVLDANDAKTAILDFEKEVNYFGLGNADLTRQLQKIGAGMLSENYVTKLLGANQENAVSKLEQYVSELNAQLEATDVMPDFAAQPKRVELSEHPVLGQVTTEVYIKNGIEWHMSQDDGGAVWVTRLRMENAESTAYGTDKQMVISGILTSKPLEYNKQVTCVPESQKVQYAGYSDITRFIDTFAPVKRYRQSKNIARIDR